MTDQFERYTPGLSSPARGAAAITPDDGDSLAAVTRAIYVGGDGDLKVDMLDGGTVTFTGVVAGQVYPIRATRVYATGTTATNLVGLY